MQVKTDLAEEQIGTLRMNVTVGGVVAKQGDAAIDLHSLEATQSSEIFMAAWCLAPYLNQQVMQLKQPLCSAA